MTSPLGPAGRAPIGDLVDRATGRPEPGRPEPGAPEPGTPAHPDLGPLAHIGLVADDFDAAYRTVEAIGVRWSSVTHPMARLTLPDGTVHEHEVAYVAAAGGEPRLKLLSAAAGSVFAPGSGTAVHHLSYWVEDIEAATVELQRAGWVVEASGHEADGSVRYRYLVHPAAGRIELGLTRNRAEFDAWADR